MCAPADHVSGFSSITRSWESPLHRDAILQALRRLPPYVLRAKGTFSFEGEENKRYVYQRVGMREYLEALEGSSAPRSGSKLVLIGYADHWKESELAALIS
jgi:G3E family GTPase